MNAPQSVCNYAILRFLPYPDSGEFVNVGVVVGCMQPCFLHFLMEDSRMPARVKAFFPEQSEEKFVAAQKAMQEEFKRLESMVNQFRDPISCQRTFHEVVRPRESLFRFSEPRTILTSDPGNLSEQLFDRYVRMKEVLTEPQLAATA